MRKFRIIALLAAVVAFVCGYRLLTVADLENNGTDRAAELRIIVVAATQDIEPYTVLTAEMLRIENIIIGEGISGYYTSPDDVIGLFCTSKIYSGEIITANRISDSDDPLGLSMQLEEGKRAVTLAVDIEQGVGNNIRVGNYVDIVFVSELKGDNTNAAVAAGLFFAEMYSGRGPENIQVLYNDIDSVFSLIALQNIKVVALDKTYISDTADSGGKGEYASVTFEATPEEAARIALLSNTSKGYIQLILRPQNDSGEAHSPIGSILQPYTER